MWDIYWCWLWSTLDVSLVPMSPSLSHPPRDLGQARHYTGILGPGPGRCQLADWRDPHFSPKLPQYDTFKSLRSRAIGPILVKPVKHFQQVVCLMFHLYTWNQNFTKYIEVFLLNQFNSTSMILVSYEYSEYDPLVNFMKCEWVPENFVVLRPSGFVEFEAVFHGHKTPLYILNGP